MRKFLVLPALVLVLTFVSVAQTPFSYSLNYYSHRNNTVNADQFVRIINPGTVGTPMSDNHGTICADIYVFDATQELSECCACPVTANGILILSVLKDLTANPLTGFPASDSGVIKLIADDSGNCNETAPFGIVELLAWGSHIQQPDAGTILSTESAFQPSVLSKAELDFLGSACAAVQYLGSGKGVCQCGQSDPCAFAAFSSTLVCH